MKRFLLPLMFLAACTSQYVPSKTPQPISQVPHPSEPTIVDAAVVEKPIIEEQQQTEPVVEPPKVVAKRVILIIGDSEACAIASSVKKAKLPTDDVHVDCKGGTVVQYWGAGGNFRAALTRHPKPDVVLVFLGTNHYWQKKTPPVESILSIIRDRGFQCVWVGPTAVHNKTWEMNGLIRDAVTPTCDFFDTEAAHIPLYDGVHPDEPAALLWLQKVWPLIPMKYEEPND